MADVVIGELKAEIDELRRAVTRLNDIQSVRTLHFKYGYYIDMCLYDEAVDLFADDCVVYILNGIFRGKESARRCYAGYMRDLFTEGGNGPVYGFLLDHFMSQDIVDVADDGLTARGRFRCLMQAGSHESKPRKTPPFDGQMWESGIHENVYVKDRGVWKIKELNYSLGWQADYKAGWAHSTVSLEPMTRTYPEDRFGPDELAPDTANGWWPNTRVVPFHYPHPVTGAPWSGTKD